MLCHIVHACIHQRVTPFVFTLEEDQRNLVYHPPLQSEIEQRLIHNLGMFEMADESYAPDNPNDAIKAAATAVIGHHDDEGIARFLRERFRLGAK